MLKPVLKNIFNPVLNNVFKRENFSQKLILLGASLEEAMKTGLQDLINTTYNVNWTVVDLATGGDTSTNIKNRVDLDLDTHGELGAYVLVHAGGNDVSNTRPYVSATQLSKDTLSNNISYIFNAITSRGMNILPCNLSFRDYDDTTVYYEEDGSKPYNDTIILPKIAQLNSPFVYGDGTPYLDLYMFIKTNINYLLTDNVHFTSTGYSMYRQFIVDTVMKKIITGVAPIQISALSLPVTPNVTSITSTTTTATVTWTMSSESNVTAYIVEYKPTSQSTWSRTTIVTAPTKTSVITGLSANTAYDIRVRASFVNNVGNFSSISSVSTTAPTVVFNDTFTNTNSTIITAHTSDSGYAWVAQTGFAPTINARINNNKLYPLSSLNVYRANFTMPSPNYEVEAVLNVLTNTGFMGINARASSIANTFYCLRYTTNQWALQKSVAGVITTLATFSQTLTAGQTLTIKLVCNGSTIQGYIDGELKLTATDTDITSAGSVGIRMPFAVTTTTGVHIDSIVARVI